MQRLNRPSYTRQDSRPIAATAFDLVVRVAQHKGVRLRDALKPRRLATILSDSLEEIRSPIRVYGRRTEEMFAYMCASMGSITALKREDQGEVVTDSTESVSIPDYRVVVRNGKEFLVEVKNWNQSEKAIRLTRPYLNRLLNYGSIFDREVLLATYWSKWRNWTVHSVQWLLAKSSGTVKLDFGEAFRWSIMHELGDVHLATEYPLTLRFLVDSKLIKRKKKTSEYLLTITGVQFLSKDKLIKNKRDQRIAWGFMRHGKWRDFPGRPVLNGTNLKAVDFIFMPIEVENLQQEGQPFAIIGSLSSLASGQFNDLTADVNRVDRLSVSKIALPPYPRPKEKYYGKDLPLWVFVLQGG